MQQVSKLKVSEFFSVASQLAFQASHVIRDIMASHDLQQKMKDIDDPMTLADIKA
jgi:3'(2'), 5'-bisphosphate nucleotidase